MIIQSQGYYHKGWFPVLRFFDLRTECSEPVNSFIDTYWAHVRKKNASLENSLNEDIINSSL